MTGYFLIDDYIKERIIESVKIFEIYPVESLNTLQLEIPYK